MARWKKLIKPLGYLAILGVLLATHAFAFHTGSAKQFQHTKKQVLQTVCACHENALQADNTLLQLAVKDPQNFQPDDLASMKLWANSHADFVEKLYLPQTIREGNFDLQQQLATEVATARNLLAKLPKP